MQKNLPDRPTMRFDQRYIGRVVNVDDPKKQLRMKIRVYGVFTDNVPDKDLPWAEYSFPPGSRENEGFVTSVEVGDYVWVDFPFSGNTRRPRMLGSVHYCPDGVPNAPHEMWLGPDTLEHKRVVAPMPAAREYFRNNVFSQAGIVVEMVPGGDGSIIVTQKATGTAIEITPDGEITLHAEGNIYAESATGDIKAVAALGSVEVSAAVIASIVAGEAITMVAPSITMTTPACALKLGENAECEGDFMVDGRIDATGDIIDGGSNTNHHSH